MMTAQFAGVPSGATPACEAGVVALKTRSIAAADAVSQALNAFHWLEHQGCTQFLFKYCSTFDSTPLGNIGPVAEALLDAAGARVAAVCPAFPETGRTLYQGHLFVKDRLLNESGMEKHPLNPMTDPDIRRWLRLQTRGEVGPISQETVRKGAETIRAAFEAEAEAGRRLVVVDAVANEDLLAIGAAIVDHRLVTGGSGIALGLPENFRKTGKSGKSGVGFPGIRGPGVVISGSCSTASRTQLTHHLQRHPGFAVELEALMEGRTALDQAVAFVRNHRDAAPAVYSTADPIDVAAAQNRYGQERVAQAIEHFFGQLAQRLVADGVTRLAIGGGETSGAVVTALGFDHFIVGPEIDPGVPALATFGLRHDIRLALKSGNFGATDFYDKALRILEAS